VGRRKHRWPVMGRSNRTAIREQAVAARADVQRIGQSRQNLGGGAGAGAAAVRVQAAQSRAAPGAADRVPAGRGRAANDGRVGHKTQNCEGGWRVVERRVLNRVWQMQLRLPRLCLVHRGRSCVGLAAAAACGLACSRGTGAKAVRLGWAAGLARSGWAGLAPGQRQVSMHQIRSKAGKPRRPMVSTSKAAGQRQSWQG
jgi:hypothetical protein